MRFFKTQFCSLYMASSSGLDRVWSRLSVAMCKNAQNCRKTGVFTLSVWNLQHEGQNRGSEKKPKFISGAAPIIIFVFFGVAPRFCKKRCFQNRRNFAETTENVVPNWRGRIRNFCNQGSEIGYLGQGNETVPIYLSLHSPSFPIRLQEDRPIVWYFWLFPFLTTGPFLSFWWLNFSSAISTWVFIMVLVKFLCFCWLCLFFWLVPLLLILLHHSFFFLYFCFVPVVYLLFWVVCLLVLVCVCLFLFFPPLASFPSLVCPSLHDLCCSYLVFLYFLLLCMYLVWLFLLLWCFSL